MSNSMVDLMSELTSRLGTMKDEQISLFMAQVCTCVFVCVEELAKRHPGNPRLAEVTEGMAKLSAGMASFSKETIHAGE